MSTLRAVAVLALVTCGPPLSLNPLSDPATAKPDGRLAGLWRGTIDSARVSLHVVPKDGATVDLVLVAEEKGKGATVIPAEAFPTILGGTRYLNVRAKTAGAWGEGVTTADEYTFLRYEVTRDGSLTLWLMDDAPVKAAVEKKLLPGTVEGGDVKVTAATSALVDFIAASKPEVLFRPLGTFRRVEPR